MTAQQAAALLNYIQATVHLRGIVSAAEALALQPVLPLLAGIAAGQLTCTIKQVAPPKAQAK